MQLPAAAALLPVLAPPSLFVWRGLSSPVPSIGSGNATKTKRQPNLWQFRRRDTLACVRVDSWSSTICHVFRLGGDTQFSAAHTGLATLVSRLVSAGARLPSPA